jgi:hypothetical protein
MNYLTVLATSGLLVLLKPVKWNHLVMSVDLAHRDAQLFVQKYSVILLENLILTILQSLMDFALESKLLMELLLHQIL